MEKIVIIGSPGAGKSTFAQALGDILHIEVFHLDRYFWKTGWEQYPRAIRIAIEQELVKGKDQWIIEGTYLSSSDARLQAADTIIFLDMPTLLCLRQSVRRHIIYRGRSCSDIPPGCTDRLSSSYILKILVFQYLGRKLLLKKRDEIFAREEKQSEKKMILTYRSHEESENFLRWLTSQRQEDWVYEEPRPAPMEPALIGAGAFASI